MRVYWMAHLEILFAYVDRPAEHGSAVVGPKSGPAPTMSWCSIRRINFGASAGYELPATPAMFGQYDYKSGCNYPKGVLANTRLRLAAPVPNGCQ